MNIIKWLRYVLFCFLTNPLPTDDAFWRRQILAAFYQLAQSILKIGSALAEMVGQGEVGGSTARPDRAWWWLQLPVEKPWSMTGGPFVCSSCTNGCRKRSLHLVGTPFLAIWAAFSPEQRSLVGGP